MSTINYNFHDTSQPIINAVNHFLPRIPIAVIVLLLGIVVIRVISHIIRLSLSVTNLPKGLQEIVTSLTDVALWIFLSIALLQEMGLNNVALALTGSFAFLVLGLVQGGAAAVADVIGGLALSKDHDFNVGDRIRIIGKVSDGPPEGIVEEIDLRRTRLRGSDGHVHILPNSTIDKTGWVLVERGQGFTHQSKRHRMKKRKLTT